MGHMGYLTSINKAGDVKNMVDILINDEYFIEKIDPAPAELSKKFLTNQDIMNMMLKYKPEAARAPDTGFMYCNSNYAVLALLISFLLVNGVKVG